MDSITQATLFTGIQELLALASPDTRNHHERTRKYTRLILQEVGAELGFTSEECELVSLYAALHDVGKVAVRRRILEKPGKLTDEEYNEVKRHTITGESWLKNVMFDNGSDVVERPDLLKNIIAQHHERLDGTGYPWGLSGDEISREAQVVAVADVFDAMTSKRTYDRVHTPDESLAEIQRMADQGKLNPLVVKGLAQVVLKINT